MPDAVADARVTTRSVSLLLLLSEPPVILQLADHVLQVLLVGMVDDKLGVARNVELVDVEAADLAEAQRDLIEDVPHHEGVQVVNNR